MKKKKSRIEKMSLEKILEKVKSAVKNTKDYFGVPGKAADMREYALDHYIRKDIKDILFAGRTQEERDEIYHDLERKLQEKIEDHSRYLDKLSSKAAYGTGLGTLLYDLYNIGRGTPFDDYSIGKYFLVGTKAALELPALIPYLVKTKDVYAAAEWAAGKMLSGLVPVLGTAFDQNVVQRNIKKRAIKEGVREFLEEKGLYKAKKPLLKRIYDRVKSIAGPIDTKIPEYQYA